ncbi:MAG: ATP-binding protein [Candidatus Saccharimonadales bacterium]
MSEGYFRQSNGTSSGISNMSSIISVTASELTSPLVLLRQLSIALSNSELTDSERIRISEQLTLTSERALRMTANLTMSVPNQTMFALEPINPVSVCQEVIHELSPLFRAYGQKITLHTRTRIPLSIANRSLLRQILLGFGDSALHYGSADRPVHMLVSGHKDSVRIGVRDYGPAVPKDIWQRLEGKIIKHARKPLATRNQASGIGLLAAKRTAEIMGGAVGMIRHRDGATFYIDLQLSDQMSLL